MPSEMKFVNFKDFVDSLPAADDFAAGDKSVLVGSSVKKMDKDVQLQKTAENALAGKVAPAFDATKVNGLDGFAYHAGDFVVQDGNLYSFKVDKESGPWDSSKVYLVDVGYYINVKKNSVEQVAKSNVTRIDNNGVSQDVENLLSPAYSASDAYVSPTSWTYTAKNGYSYKTFAVAENDVIRVKGSIDVDTKIVFTDQIYSVEQSHFVALAFRTFGELEFDYYIKVPAGATYILVSGKTNDFPSISKIVSVSLDTSKIPNASILPEKLSEEVWTSVKIPIDSDNVVANSRSNQTGSYTYTDSDYDLISYPVKVGTYVRMVSRVDKNCGWHFCNWKYTVYGHVVSTPFSVSSADVPANVDVVALVPSGVTHLIASVKRGEPVNIYEVSTDKFIPSNVVSGLGKKVIYVSVDGDDATGDGSQLKPYATIKKANDSILISGPELRYVIKVADGTYNDLETLYSGVDPNGNLQGVMCKPYVEYVGNEEHPENVVLEWNGKTGYDETWTYDDVGFYKCLFHLRKSSAIRGFTIKAINTRYALHIETFGYGDDVEWEVSDCILEWGGVPGRSSQPSAFGTGSSHFEKGHILRCVVKNDSGVPGGFMNHDSAYNYGKPFKEGAEIKIESCNFGAGAQGATNVIFRSINGDSAVDGYNRCSIMNCIGIKKFGYELSGSSTEINWRAEVKCSQIETNEFANNGKMQ